MKIINSHLAQNIKEQNMLMPPNKFGYIHLAAEIETPYIFKKDSQAKKALIKKLKSCCETLTKNKKNINRADIFTAIIIPPGSKEGRKLIKEKNYSVHIAKFDLSILIECKSVDDIKAILQSETYKEIENMLKNKAKYVHTTLAKNSNRINEVNKDKQGIFLFNYFYAEDPQTLLDVWEYTAGWWTAKANLTNSTPLQPLNKDAQYTLINHCRWDNLFEILPALIFRPDMKNFVLKNFTANHIVAMPILYKLAL